MTEKQYDARVKELSPRSPVGKDCIWAFCVGGVICVLGQVLINWYLSLGLEKQDASGAASMTIVAAAALLTGLGIFVDIAKRAGAGALVPITGFANAIAAPAVEFQTEGRILGTAAKMFTIAGPVIVYGVTASVIYGVIYWLYTV